jgi:hypothetical protein
MDFFLWCGVYLWSPFALDILGVVSLAVREEIEVLAADAKLGIYASVLADVLPLDCVGFLLQVDTQSQTLDPLMAENH